MSAKPEKWTRDELKALIRDLKENAKENRQQAKDDRDRRAPFLEGGAEAFEYAAKQIARILKGKTVVEDLAATLAPHMTPKA